MAERVFITGGASGLGLALAQRYVRSGAQVCIGDIDDDRGRAAEASLGPAAFYLRCDVTQEDDLQRVADGLQERWGGVDIVVNNAGVAVAGAIDEVSMALWDWITNINLLGVVRGCRVFTPVFKRQGSGCFINIASMAGLTDLPLTTAYTATKAAVVAFSESLQNELQEHRIQVVVACPAFFRTALPEAMRGTNSELVSVTQRLMEKSGLQATDVADRIVRAARAGRFYVLTHPGTELMWWVKCVLPRSWWRYLMRSQVQALLRRARKV